MLEPGIRILKENTMKPMKKMLATKICRDAADLLESLQFTKIERRSLSTGGAWVTGTIDCYRFEALVFPEHATIAGFELGESRISKLWIEQTSDPRMVACFDRGWDLLPANQRVGQVVNLLSAGLAETVFGK
jgi:hypothetical protein